MTQSRHSTGLPKWPFYLAHALMLGIAIGLLLRGPAPVPPLFAGLAILAVAIGAAFTALPFILEHQAALRNRNADDTDRVSQLRHQLLLAKAKAEEATRRLAEAARENMLADAGGKAGKKPAKKPASPKKSAKEAAPAEKTPEKPTPAENATEKPARDKPKPGTTPVLFNTPKAEKPTDAPPPAQAPPTAEPIQASAPDGHGSKPQPEAEETPATASAPQDAPTPQPKAEENPAVTEAPAAAKTPEPGAAKAEEASAESAPDNEPGAPKAQTELFPSAQAAEDALDEILFDDDISTLALAGAIQEQEKQLQAGQGARSERMLDRALKQSEQDSPRKAVEGMINRSDKRSHPEPGADASATG